MPIRLATQTDEAAIVALYQASPLAGVYGPITGIQPLFFDADAIVVVNDTSAGLNACLIARPDHTTKVPAVCILFIIATSLLAVRSVLRQVATVAQARGFGSMYGVINMQAATLATTRAYLEARFPYLDTDTAAVPTYRVMGDSMANFIAKA